MTRLALAFLLVAVCASSAPVASAAQRGDVVYTSDVGDLLGFADVFPGVRVLGVGGVEP